jgi:hypothetical protein
VWVLAEGVGLTPVILGKTARLAHVLETVFHTLLLLLRSMPESETHFLKLSNYPKITPEVRGTDYDKRFKPFGKQKKTIFRAINLFR